MDPEVITQSVLPTFNLPWHLMVDGGIILFYFTAILLVGLLLSQKDRKMSEFALGGRSVPWWAVMASIIAAETSAATYLGVPQEGYSKQSFAYVQLFVGLIIGRYLVGWFMIKPYYALRVYTVYDYAAIRFGSVSRNYLSVLFLIMRTLASGTRLFIPSLVIVLAWQLFVQQKPVTELSTSAASNSVFTYFLAILALTVITCAYTAVGGIKSVIWTEIIQASLMFGSALLAIGTLFYHLSDQSFDFTIGFKNLMAAVPQLGSVQGYLITGFEPAAVDAWMKSQKVETMSLWQYVKLTLASEYTLFAAVLGATFGNMAAFGTDQAMVQRMLTAENYEKSRRSLITAALMALPIATVFSLIGILLYAFYQMYPQTKPLAASDVFPTYILGSMPVGVRGIVLAGVFATAMGSFSAALNSLATSATNDIYIPLISKGEHEDRFIQRARRVVAGLSLLSAFLIVMFAISQFSTPDMALFLIPCGLGIATVGTVVGVWLVNLISYARLHHRSNYEAHSVTVARVLTVVFAVLMIGIATAFAWAKVANPDLRLIPVVLGIGGFILGPMLGIFLLGMWTKTRGNDRGNIIAITAGLLTTIIMSKVLTDFLYGKDSFLWIPKVSFTWFALIGAAVVFAVGALFRTPEALVRMIKMRAEQCAQEGYEDTPLSLRSDHLTAAAAPVAAGSSPAAAGPVDQERFDAFPDLETRKDY